MNSSVSRLANFLAGLSWLLLGIGMLYNTVPLLLEPAAFKAAMVDLPSLFSGIAPTGKFLMSVCLLAIGGASVVWGAYSLRRRVRRRTIWDV